MTNKRSLLNFNPDRLTMFATLCTMTSINLTTEVRGKFNELIANARPPDPVEPEDYEQPVIAQSVAGGAPVEDAYGDAPAYIPGEPSSSWTPQQDPERPADWYPQPTGKAKKKKKKRTGTVEE